jgi:CRISPR-associated endonuclease/helicase Cas3
VLAEAWAGQRDAGGVTAYLSHTKRMLGSGLGLDVAASLEAGDRRMVRSERPERFVARIVREKDGSWRQQALLDHLIGTGELAAVFAGPFGAGEWARLAGRLHDLGKYQPAWQNYIRRTTGFWTDEPAVRAPHAIVGAIHAVGRFGDIGRLLAYSIAGHHAGLPDWHSSSVQPTGYLANRLADRERWELVLREPIPLEITEPAMPPLPAIATAEGMHLWIRMLFSCLVDADSLDAERFADVSRTSTRDAWNDLAQLLPALDGYLAGLPRRGAIDDLRTDIRAQAVSRITERPGFFSLTVPTGGGKTLTSLEFAIRHALQHGQQRVIYAIPYVSIIEQTAEVFRKALGDRFAVLEHHANLDPKDTDEESELAAETWDAPIVVTTIVQLFESLFGSTRGRSRKVHNIAGSVLVLDEAQLLPPQFLNPITSILSELVRGYGVSVVLSTATQPALGPRLTSGRPFRGIEGVRELMDAPETLWPALDRVTITWPADLDERYTWEDVATKLVVERQVLCVVNTRADCRRLTELMPDDTVHLSALMCAEHRSTVIAGIKARLKADERLRVVSTQLVEAGVDIDFPVVFRALAGLDSIAQSAGRCNREGRLDRGRVQVFVPPTPAPIGHLRKGEQATRALLSSMSADEALTPAGFRRYFDLLYSSIELDKEGIVAMLTEGAHRGEFPFKTVAAKFQLIAEEGSGTVLVPFGDTGLELVERLEGIGPERWLLRRLQRFTVSIHQGHVRGLLAIGAIREVGQDTYTLVERERYDPRLGLVVDDLSVVMEGLLA